MLRGTGGGRLVVRLVKKSGETCWRHVRTLEHEELCHAFELSPVHARFDLPKSATNPGGSSQSGYRGKTERWRTIDGYLLWNGDPIGRVMITWSGEKFRDVEFEELLR